MTSDIKDKVVSLLKESRSDREKHNDHRITINGNANAVGNGNTIILTEKHITKTKAEPKPGKEHINESQVRKLHDLKDKIIELERITKKNPASHQKVWSVFNKKMGIGSMRMLPSAKFKAGEKFLNGWIGRLTSSRMAEKKARDTVEKTKLKYIRTNMRKLNCEERVRDYMDKNFGVRSTTDLPDLGAIKQVYSFVASIKASFEQRKK
ncbi:hypothetical protein [Desulfofustis glycolicus]|uniref:Uncharacterized protein n=1 Tax=Desulfofustis glycolicus DSM 9705 TaxID=1121409 RepID=A0A1M5S8H9_9BACT|nr:hypothetical protein [Desulfofustis glycolicus]SHH34233.1 hypothetical protein SAMN02745124_00193 [Desulfofustis glycolicus DSM 9705]